MRQHLASSLALLSALAATCPLSYGQQIHQFTGGNGHAMTIGGAGEDVDGDGVPDLLLLAPGASFGDGGVRVRSGADGSLIHLINSSQNNGFGRSGDLVGDLDGDGRSEFIVGAWLDDSAGNDAGRAFVFSGATGTTFAVLDGFEPEGIFGLVVRAAGDVDGDGTPDFAVGAPSVGAGQIYIFSGSDSSLIRAITTAGSGNLVGRSFRRAGDVNADGFEDLIVGIETDDTGGSSAGKAEVYSGADGTLLYEWFGSQASDFFGRAVSFAGDVNQDGFDDVLVGASGSDEAGNLAGKVWVYSGADGSTLHTFLGWRSEDALGDDVVGLGDVDGDGAPDLALGASFSNILQLRGGYVRVHSGADGRLLHLWHGPESLARFSEELAAAGDLDGDGSPDLAVGISELGNTGGVSVFSGGFPVPASYCFADGVGTACPCGNLDEDGGCANSTGEGGRLIASGSQSIQADNLYFTLLDLPPFSFAAVFLGPDADQVPFGNGQLCVGGPFQRFPVVGGGFGSAYAYGPGLPRGIDVGMMASSYVQGWYRDPGGPCGANTNLTNAVRIDWLP